MEQLPSPVTERPEYLLFDRITGIWHARELFEKELYRDAFSDNRREESVKMPLLKRVANLPTHP